MAFMHLIRLLLCFLAVLSFSGADDAVDKNDDSVIIGPPENITAYLNGSTNIVVTWDPPPVYLVHDFLNTSLDHNSTNEVVDSKLSNIALNESTSSQYTTIPGTPVMASQNNSTDNSSAVSPPTNDAFKCRPISFFGNYTVGVKDDPDMPGQEVVVAFKDSILRHKLNKVIRKENTKIVFFSQGCVTNYVVSCVEAENPLIAVTMSVLPTTFTANITGLKPNTTYKVVVTAVYASGDKIDSSPPSFFTTKRGNESKACTCDMYGATTPSSGCNTTGAPYCNCKPGYEGSFCEKCSRGYYRSAPHFQCHRCPCDNYSGGRTMTPCAFVEGFLKCESCETGYTGSVCQECSKDFYRFNGRCAACFCNLNTLPTTSRKCLHFTGACLDCQRNTTGFYCERCLPGYVGDAIKLKNCALPVEAHAASVSSGVVAAVVVTLILVILLVAAGILFKRYHSKARLRAFWTIEMKKDNDDVDFSSVHNDDARLDDVEDADYFSKHGLSTSSNKYSRLNEDI